MVWWGSHSPAFVSNVWQVFGIAGGSCCLIWGMDVFDVKEDSLLYRELMGLLQQPAFCCWWFFGISLLSFPPSGLLTISCTECLLFFFLSLEFLRSSVTSWKQNEMISFSASKLPLRSLDCFVLRAFCKQSKPFKRTTDPSQSDQLSSVTIFVHADACFMSPFRSF